MSRQDWIDHEGVCHVSTMREKHTFQCWYLEVRSNDNSHFAGTRGKFAGISRSLSNSNKLRLEVAQTTRVRTAAFLSHSAFAVPTHSRYLGISVNAHTPCTP